jgi:DNA modification methylase
MPESVKDRCTRSHEYIFLLTKSARYDFNADAIAEKGMGWERFAGRNGRKGLDASRNDYGRGDLTISLMHNRRDVWTIQGEPYGAAHFATFPTKLVELCILAGSPAGGMILDPFGGCGTTGEVAVKLGRRATLIELNPEYCAMIERNLGLFAAAI